MAFSISSFSDLPSGFRFFPTDAELMVHLWIKVIKGNYHYHHRFISVHDVYKQAPWNLPWDRSNNRYFHGIERFFFVQRKPISGKDSRMRPKRTVDSGEGWWHSNTEDTPVMDDGGSGTTVGYVKSLTFFVKDEEKRKQQTGRGNLKQEGTKTDWIMHEYVLDKKNVKGWVLCRIRYNGKQPLVIPSDASTSTIHPPPQMSSQFCGGPDPQLRPLKRQKTGVSVQEVHHQLESYAPLMFNKNVIQEMGAWEIGSMGLEWPSERVHERVVEETLVEDLVEMGGSLQQPAEKPWEECDGEFAKELENMLEMNSETLVVMSPLQQQQPAQTFEEYAEELESILEINSEALLVNLAQQQPILEECDMDFAAEAEATMEKKSDAVTQPQLAQQPRR
ncbi:hypothetical protein SLEP1_g436 [Rubroshorea leprosula]|uniref:NAC domain-containing protein n=2 Tax=Rubroshorea leprosula TaxID=152421 RepID=A0AAV5HHH6_9ROSI|nr:hypothetical protein SLEP1_g436 [Rubroshorea leprosula]